MDKLSRPTPRKIFIFLTSSILLLAVLLLSLGVTAFTFTTNFKAGAFYTSLLLFASGIYNFICLVCQLFYNEKRFVKLHRRKMGMISSAISCLCFIACIVGFILDIIAAYQLQNTDFTQCAYTGTNTTVSCSSPTCPTLALPARTCYCCYLYDSRTEGGCDSPMFLAKQTYFSGVESCTGIDSFLRPLLSSTGGINLLAAIISVVYVFQTDPVQYRDEKGATKAGNKHEQGSKFDKIFHWAKGVVKRITCCARRNEPAEQVMEATNENYIDVTNT